MDPREITAEVCGTFPSDRGYWTRSIQPLSTRRLESPFRVSRVVAEGLEHCKSQEDQPISTDIPEVVEPYYEIDRILRWRKIKRKKIAKKILFYGEDTVARL